MKSTTAHLKVFILLFAILFVSLNKLLAQSDPHRGLYIDDFALSDASGNLLPTFSILGQTAKEDSVLLYCKENHITYITLYGLNQVLDNDTANSHKDTLLMNFIIKARRYYGIKEVGAANGSKPAVDRIDTIYQQRLSHPTPAYNFSHDEKYSGYYTPLKFVENAYQEDERLFMVSEITKDFLKISAYNRALPIGQDSGRFDVLNLEFEFWNPPAGQNADTLYLRAQGIMQHMARVRNMNNSLATTRKLKTEIYLGYLDRGTVSSLSKTVFIDGHDTIGSSKKLVDRILLHYYNTDPDTVYLKTNYFPRYQDFRNSTTLDTTLIHPLFSGASTALGYGENHFGSWFPKSNRNNIFTAEKEWFEDARRDSATGGTHRNRFEYGGAQWYTRDVLVNKRGTPTLMNHTNTFYTNSPVNTNGAASGSVDFTYSGPIEDGTTGLLRIYDSLGTTKIDSALFTIAPFNGTTYLIKTKTLNTGNYLAILKLTYANGFSYIYKERVIVRGRPTIFAQGATTFCDGGSVILKSSRTKYKTSISGNVLSYHWYRNSIALTSGYDPTTQYYNVTLGGYYKCRIDTNASASAIFTDSILVTILDNNPVSIAQISHGGPNFNLTANGTHVTGTTYNWDNGQSTRSIDVYNYDSYRVIVTQPSGCKREAQVTLQTYCSSKDFDFVLKRRQDTLASIYGKTAFYPGDSLILQNNYHIDQNISFRGAYVQCEPGVKITVDSAVTLTISDTSIFVACSNMWRGIEVKKGGKIIVDSSSVIEGAQYAINLLNGSDYWLRNSSFNKNYVGLRINGYTHTVYGAGAYNKLNFSCSTNGGAQDTLPLPYLGQMPTPSIKSLTGIQLQESLLYLFPYGVDSINFTNLSNGITSYNSFMELEKCVFRNIRSDSFYDSIMPVNGAGVNIKNINTGSARVRGFGHTASKENFKNCDFAVSVFGRSAEIWGNRCSNVTEAVRVTSNSKAATSIYNNIFNVDHIGVNILHCDLARNISITDDTINVGETSGSALGNVGVKVSMTSNDDSDSSISIYRNVINLYSAVAGIECNSVYKGQIKDNHINIERTNVYTCNGIRMENCNDLKALGNTINGSDASDSLQIGISVAISHKPKLYCNYTDNTYDGIFIDNTCDQTDMRSNDMHDHALGLHLSYSADIDTQNWRGNRWTGTYSILGAYNQNPSGSAITSSQFLVNTSDSSTTYKFLPASFYPTSGWFVIDVTHNNFRCRDLKFGGDVIEEEPEEPEEELRMGPRDSIVAEGDLQFEEFELERNFTIDRDLYHKISIHPELREAEILDSFYSSNQASIIGNLESVNETKQSIISNYSSGKLDSLNEVLNQKLYEIGGSSDQNQVLDLGTYAQDIHEQIEMEYTDLKSEINTDIDDLISENNSISTSVNIEDYGKTVNDIYLNTIAKEIYSFNPQQKSELYTIAHLCPLEGGKAVYLARSIYTLIDTYQYYDDKAMCEVPSSDRKASIREVKATKALDELAISISPIPTRDYVTIVGLEQNDQIIFQLYNNLSEKVIDQTIDSKTIDLNKIKNGVYYYIIFHNGIQTKNGKLVVIK